MEQKLYEKSREKSSPQFYLELDNKAQLFVKTKKTKNNLFKKDEYGFSYYTYDGTITNTAKQTSYRDVLVSFSFTDKEGNLLDQLSYKIEEVINVGESQKFKLNIEEPKNKKDIASFNATITKAEVLSK
jgi:hypothetical protein